jgi:mRNA interferase MazF
MGNVFYNEFDYTGLTDDELRNVPLHRGDIIIVDMGKSDNSLGSEQRGYRPAIVVQNNVGNTYSTTIIVALITKQLKTHIPTHMHLDLYEPSTVLTEQVRTLDKARLQRKLGDLKLNIHLY